MEVLDNYVFFHICEHTLRIFEKSGYKTYIGFCTKILAAIEMENFTRLESSKLAEILENIKLIFDFEDVTGFIYIRRYFIEEKYKIFEYPMRMLKEYHGFSFN